MKKSFNDNQSALNIEWPKLNNTKKKCQKGTNLCNFDENYITLKA